MNVDCRTNIAGRSVGGSFPPFVSPRSCRRSNPSFRCAAAQSARRNPNILHLALEHTYLCCSQPNAASGSRAASGTMLTRQRQGARRPFAAAGSRCAAPRVIKRQRSSRQHYQGVFALGFDFGDSDPPRECVSGWGPVLRPVGQLLTPTRRLLSVTQLLSHSLCALPCCSLPQGVCCVHPEGQQPAGVPGCDEGRGG